MTPALEELMGQAALDALARRWALHDGRIRRLTVEAALGSRPSITLEVVPRERSPVEEAVIHITAVSRLDVGWDVSDPEFYLVAGYKALLLDSGRVYLSLDPYDDQDNATDGRDGSVIEGETIAVALRMKP